MEIKSTRLRSISFASLLELQAAVGALSFKIEIKGQPTEIEGGWIVHFTIPDNAKFNSIDGV